MENLLSPLNVTLTGDQLNMNGGLSYSKKYSNHLNVKLIRDYYKHLFNIDLPKDTHIIFGGGTTMMIAAYYYALQKKENKNILINTNNDIFYLLHQKLTYPIKNVKWTSKDYHSDLTVVVSPSNPLGLITEPKEIKSKYMLYDVVYDIYIFTGQYKSVNKKLYEEFSKNKNISITASLSKLGLAGTRFGYLLTRDEQIAKYCKEYVNTILLTYSASSATIVRTTYYKYFSDDTLFSKIYNIIKYRYDVFIKYAIKHNIKILNKTHNVPFIYTDKSADWWLKKFNIETTSGSHFNDTNNCSRINLMLSKENWDEFERRLIKSIPSL